MNHKNFTRSIFWRLWIPELISAFGLAFADMADAWVLGRRAGAVGMAAISLCLPIYMFMNVFMHSLGLGGSTFFSRYLGEGSEDRAVASFNNTIRPALLMGMLLCVVGSVFTRPILHLFGTVPADGEIYKAAESYARILFIALPFYFSNFTLNYFLRNDDKQKIAAISFTTANILDLVLNMLFVLVFRWGTAGAAFATLCGQVIANLIYLPALIGKKGHLRLTAGRIEWKQTFRYFANGFSVSVQYICQFVFLLLINNRLMRESGAVGVAVFELLQSLTFLFSYVFGAAAKGMQPLLGTYNGESNEKEVRKTGRIGFTAGMLTGGILVLVFGVFPQLACMIFGLEEPGIAEMASGAVRVFCVSQIAAGIGILLENYYQSCEVEKNALALTLLRGTIILLPVTVLFCSLGGGMIWYLYPVTELLSILIFAVWKHFFGEEMHIKGLKKYIYEIENTNQEISGLSEAIGDACAEWGVPMKLQFKAGMTAEEICLAIMEKNKEQTKAVFIQVTVVLRSHSGLELHLRDNGLSFNPFELNGGKVGEEDFDEAAMGMIVVKKQASEFLYRKYQGFNTITVRF